MKGDETMGICRDVFGRLSYTAVNSNKSVYSVTNDRSGYYKIIEHQPWYKTDAKIFITKEMAFWVECPKFDSFVQAVKFLKENLEDLL